MPNLIVLFIWIISGFFAYRLIRNIFTINGHRSGNWGSIEKILGLTLSFGFGPCALVAALLLWAFDH